MANGSGHERGRLRTGMACARWLGCAIILAVAGAWLFHLVLGEPELPIAIANGRYANGCCGTIILHDGKMTLGQGQQVSYSIWEDKDGPYVLPAAFAGIRDGHGFQIERGGSPLKLHLDGSAAPRAIMLYDRAANAAYVFVRQQTVAQ